MVAYSLEPNNQQVQHLQPYYNSIIFIDSILLQCLHTHALQRPLIRSLEHNLRHLLIIIPRPILKRLLPPRHTQAPLAPPFQTDAA